MSLISLALKATSHGCPKDQRPIVEFNPKLYFDNFQHFVIPLREHSYMTSDFWVGRYVKPHLILLNKLM